MKAHLSITANGVGGFVVEVMGASKEIISDLFERLAIALTSPQHSPYYNTTIVHLVPDQNEKHSNAIAITDIGLRQLLPGDPGYGGAHPLKPGGAPKTPWNN